jgi:hypothetical protein
VNEKIECCSAPRDYEAEINQLRKELYCLHEELERLTDKNKLLEKCIIEMSVVRYVFNER